MATNPDETDISKRGHIGEEARAIAATVSRTITGSPSLNTRTVVLFLVAIVCVCFSPIPMNAIGVGAILLIAMGWRVR